MTEHWHEQDDFWLTLADRVFHQDRWAEAPEEKRQLCAFLAIPAGSRILDLCCGPGRHALALARMGHRVTGVDRTQRYIDDATLKASTEGLSADFICADMRTLTAPGPHDSAEFFDKFVASVLGGWSGGRG